MANKRKEGLTHFPLDVDIFDDEKLMLAEELVDNAGYDTALRGMIDKVLLRLYCRIFKNGYHITWDNSMRIAISRATGAGMTTTLLTKIITALVSAKLFDENLFKERNILTSRRIQSTWLEVVVRARRVHQSINKDYILLTPDEVKLIKNPKAKSSVEKSKNVAETNRPAAESKNQQPRQPFQTLSNTSKSGNSVTESTKPSAETQKQHPKNHKNSHKNVDNHTLKGKSAEDSAQSVTEKEKNVAESEKPFTLNSSSIDTKDIITSSILNGKGKSAEDSVQSVTEKEKNVAESENKDVFMVISDGDTSQHPIEICLYNFTHPNFSLTFDQICMGYYFSPELIKKWALAYNRFLISTGVRKKAMIGSGGWCQHLGNWIRTQRNYNTIDPDTLYAKLIERQKHPANNGVIPGSGASEEEVQQFYTPRVYN